MTKQDDAVVVGELLPNVGMKKLTEQHDWAATPLGARVGWSATLRTTIDLMLASGHAMCVIWGPERILLYNDGYVPVLGSRHPAALGKATATVWPELWSDIKPLVDRTFAGESFVFHDQPLVMTRNGFEEQTWWDFAYSPVTDENGAVVGLLNITSDSTDRVLALRDRDTALEDLRASEGRLAALVEASSDSLYTMSADWQEMRHLRGRGFLVDTVRPEVRWKDAYVPQEDRAHVERAIAIAIEKGEPLDFEHRARRADGGTGWIFSRAVPVRDTQGQITEWFGMAADVTARHQAEEALRASEAFMASVLSASTDCLKVLELDGRIAFMSEGGQRVMEVSDFNAIAGCPWPDFWHGEGNTEAVAAIEAARKGEARSFIGKAMTMKGTPKWWHVAVSPIFGADGKPARILSVSRDITELRASEEDRDRFKRLAENSTDFIAMAHHDGTVFYLNDAGKRMVGLEGTNAPYDMAAFFSAEGAARNAGEILPAVQQHGQWTGELDFKNFKTGETIPTLHSVFAIEDTLGNQSGYGTVTRDFRDHKRAEEEQKLLTGELAHRLKNMFGVVQAIAFQTLGPGENREEVNNFNARLKALADAQDVLTRESWSAASLVKIATGVLTTFDQSGRIKLAGPEIMIGPRAALALSLLLHELATNAVKYGALSVTTGNIRLVWSLAEEDGKQVITMDWVERGGPPAVQPTRRGFGSRIIRMGLTGSGGVDLSYGEQGFSARMTAPLDRLQQA